MTFPVQKLCEIKERTVLKKFAVEEGERNSELARIHLKGESVIGICSKCLLDLVLSTALFIYLHYIFNLYNIFYIYSNRKQMKLQSYSNSSFML